MKTEQLIVQYLYSNKKLTLQDIGVFSITNEIIIPEDSDKDIVLPADTIQFAFDPKAPVDEGLVAFIMESTRKIKPLASSDLESFIILNKQFLNIGKPMVFEGLGTLQKTQSGTYSFTQATSSHVTTEDLPKLITEKIKEKVSFATPHKEKNTTNNKKVIGGLVALVIGIIAVSAFFLLNKNNTPSTGVITENTAQETLPDGNMDTLVKPTSLTKPNGTAAVKDSSTFYIVIKEFTNIALANKSFKKLTSYGNKVVLTTKDSVTYKLRMPFIKPLTDTLTVRDSIAKFFKAKAYVELP